MNKELKHVIFKKGMNHPERCKKIETMIKTLSCTQMEELFKILQKNNCDYTINNNGIFLNLSWLNSSILNQIELFINFCKESKKELDKYEQICKELTDDIDQLRQEEKEDLDVSKEDLDEEPGELSRRVASKISSSMKFYLLKKKFQKSNTSTPNQKDRDLHKEEYLLLKK